MTTGSVIDRLAEATGDRLHWDDPGMDDFEAGWKEFPLGTRVEVRAANDVWRKGTIVETIRENDRGITVDCDEKWHNNKKFYGGRGATVMVYMNTRRGILSNLRKINEPRRKVVIPHREPVKLKGKSAELLKVAEIAVQHSGGRLRLAFNEEDKSEGFVGSAARFLKLDGKRFGRDIELYGFMGDDIAGWQETLVMFLEEILLPLKGELPESYVKAGEALRTFGEKVYPENILQWWRDLF
ncbi:MAG: hypothetical protein AAB617_03105 [Patescibacteria group bacterium]